MSVYEIPNTEINIFEMNILTEKRAAGVMDMELEDSVWALAKRNADIKGNVLNQSSGFTLILIYTKLEQNKVAAQGNVKKERTRNRGDNKRCTIAVISVLPTTTHSHTYTYTQTHSYTDI